MADEHPNPNSVYPQQAKEALPESIRSDGWIQTCHWLPSIDSTNSFLKKQLERSSQSPLPWLVVADEQTAGRGRSENVWWSDSGSLTFSLAVDRPAFRQELSLVVAMAVRQGLQDWIVTPSQLRIKWPNDLYLGPRKLGGILIETIRVDGKSATIIGIGLNISTDFSKAPAEVRTRATSLTASGLLLPELLTDLDSNSVNRYSALAKILHLLEIRLAQAEQQSTFSADEWNELCFLRGKKIEVESAGERIEGLCTGIAPDGGLQVVDHSDLVRLVYSGEVKRWSE